MIFQIRKWWTGIYTMMGWNGVHGEFRARRMFVMLILVGVMVLIVWMLWQVVLNLAILKALG